MVVKLLLIAGGVVIAGALADAEGLDPRGTRFAILESYTLRLDRRIRSYDETRDPRALRQRKDFRSYWQATVAVSYRLWDAVFPTGKEAPDGPLPHAVLVQFEHDARAVSVPDDLRIEHERWLEAISEATAANRPLSTRDPLINAVTLRGREVFARANELQS